MQIFNIWRSIPNDLKTLVNVNTSELVQQQEEYCIYKIYFNHYVYTYKNFAFSELCALNLDHFNNVINNTPPKENSPAYWLYMRAKETLQKINSFTHKP